MNNVVLNKWLCVFTLFFTINAKAQDPTFTQFYSNPLYLNPAFAGSHGCPRFTINYRNEWPSLSANYVTYAAAYDQYFKQISGGFGVLGTYDTQGSNTISTAMLGVVYSYHLKVNRKFTLMFGARAAVYNKSLDFSKLTFGDQIDPRKGFIYTSNDYREGNGSKFFFDASAGIVGYTKRFFFGVAAHHLNTPNESLISGESKLPMRFTVHGGADIPLGKDSKFNTNKASIMPNVIYQYQNGAQELNIGTYFKYSIFNVGFWFRNRDAFIVTAGINTGVFKIGYSYDITISEVNNKSSGGSHEISLGLNLRCKVKKQGFKMISCPSF